MTWREYHEATKHSVESLKRMRQVLDWANMPDPFRHYEGVPVLDLPADPPVPAMSTIDVLRGTFGTTPVGDGPTLLSQTPLLLRSDQRVQACPVQRIYLFAKS